jgi:2-polyprenyl-3-methyl-5-hydroxy-6-metoxy-1,4-benzoquinol methylase
MKRGFKPSIFCIVTIVFAGFAQTASTDEAIWKDFLKWLDAQPPNSRPIDLIRPYREEMLRNGVPPTEADRRLDLVSNLVFRRPDGVKLLWNKVYAGKNPIFVETPTALLVSAIEGRRHGKALDVGMGQGRNSVFLAMAGWDVTGFDPADEGIRIAEESARKSGVKIHTIVARDDEFDYGKDQWDLIVITYVRLLNEADAERLWNALKPGGIVVYENGASDSNRLLRAFLKYHIVRFENVDANPDWNPTQKIRVERLVAEKEVH